METSRKGYLAAISASSYSYVSLLKHFVPMMNPGTLLYSNHPIFFSFLLVLGCLLFQLYNIYCIRWRIWNWHKVSVAGGSSISLTYIASERIIPGYVCHALIVSLILFTELSILIGWWNSDIWYTDTVEAWVLQKLLWKVTHKYVCIHFLCAFCL